MHSFVLKYGALKLRNCLVATLRVGNKSHFQASLCDPVNRR